MNELALFAGAGGGILGSILSGWRTVCAVEIEPYCREVLLRRQRDGVLPVFPIWDDIRNFDGREWRGLVDVVSAGFPCQPFSLAGKKLGEQDDRNLWPETARVLGEVRPRFAFLENVTGLLAHRYFGAILGDLAALGYDAEWCVLGADDAGAPHKRKRLWIMAYSEERGLPMRGSETQPRSCGHAVREGGEVADPAWWDCDPADVDDTEAPIWRGGGSENPRRGTAQVGGSGSGSNGVQHSRKPSPNAHPAQPNDSGTSSAGESGRWGLESRLGRVAHGVAYRVDRLSAIGNGQVPAVVALAWETLMARAGEGA